MRYYLNLASGASNAAIAIDHHLLGRAVQEEYQNINILSERLYGIVKNHDIMSEMMMGDVIWPNREDWKGKTVEDTKLQKWLFAKDLETLTELSRERQEELRGTCLSLSRTAQRYSSLYKRRFLAA